MRTTLVICLFLACCIPYPAFSIQHPASGIQYLASDSTFPFRDTTLSYEKRLADLESRLTLKEKTSLMLYNSPAIERLGIPAYNWWSECLHGVARAGKATVFPQAIGLAATWDPELVYRVGCAISDEARAKHNAAVAKDNRDMYTGLSFWTPNINIFRDPRWGRGQETYGEDPLLTSTMGVQLVKGLQGPDPMNLKVSACAKHFVVHSGPEESRHRFDAVPTDRDFRETYLPAFKTLVDSGVESVMCAYNRLYGLPCCGSKPLLTDILRNEWGFKGHIVSDCWALDDIWARHKVVANRQEAAAMAANAGVNLNCGYIYQYLAEAVEKGLVSEETVNADFRRLMMTRFKLGLFNPEEKNRWSAIPESVVDCPQNRALAREAAQKSVVLLKNNKALPLDRKTIKNILVAGATATDLPAHLGNYNGYSGTMVTLLEGIIGHVDAGTVVEHNQGFIFNNDSSFQGFWQAKRADAIIVCLGINPLFEGEEGEAMYNPVGGDRQKIELPANQVKFIRKMRENNKNKPIIALVTAGCAMAMPEVDSLADAVLYCWYPGEEGGNAVADILFGDVNPSGKLPVTFYRSTSDLPDFDDYSMQNRTYRYFKGKALYPFGFGLSYTTFDFTSMEVTAPSKVTNGWITVKLTIKNTGNSPGTEVTQIYTSHTPPTTNHQPLTTDPIRNLAAFKRISLKAGESRVAEFRIHVSKLSSWSEAERRFALVPGNYRIEAGSSSANIKFEKEIVIR
jgi:beta-glucosidase